MQTITKYFLVGFTVTLLTVFGHGRSQQDSHALPPPETHNANTKIERQEQARTLTQRGHQELQVGQPETALQTWQAASQLYRQLGNQEGISGSLINQSLALQAMGQYPRACNTLLQALVLEDWVCQAPFQVEQYPLEPAKVLTQMIQAKQNQPVMVIGLRSLGDVLRQLGKSQEAKVILQQAREMAQLTATTETSNILLSLANTERNLYLQAKDKFLITSEPLSQATAIKTLQDRFRSALALYQLVGQSSETMENNSGLEAQLNHFSLLVDLEQWGDLGGGRSNPTVKATRDEFRPQVSPLLEQLLDANFDQLPPMLAVYGRLNFANSLQQISQTPELSQQLFSGDRPPITIALQQTQAALLLAEKLDNHRARSYALGTLGGLYLQSGQPKRARSAFQAALAQAQSVQAWDIAYRWQHELGQMYQQAANPQEALQFYQAAIASLDQVRGNLLSITPEIQFSFREKVEPVYRDFLRLLLQTDKPNLDQALQTYEKLQIAELENFLQCGKLDYIALSELKNTSNPPTYLHVINLGNQIEVIVRSPDNSLHRYTPDAELVRRNTDSLLINLQDKRLVDISESSLQLYSQELYKLLIAPARQQGYLPESGNLTFILDNSLQNIPMGLLHDGQDYLVKDYSISVALGSQIRQPKALRAGDLKALVAGLSKNSPSFLAPNVLPGLPSLPEVALEVEDIKNNTDSSVVLLNEAFTRPQLQQKFDTSTFPVVHISTHGQFSSDPEQTLLLAWNQAINVRQLDRLFRSNRQSGQDLIELLVLSACQTAQGDKRSVLGLAGVATQAGARSTIASLWLVDAASTAELMEGLYQGLKAGLPKAEALRQAQISLSQSPKYAHPYYWSGFVLVGSWL